MDRVPCEGDLDLPGLSIAPQDLRDLLTVDSAAFRAEIPRIQRHFNP